MGAPSADLLRTRLGAVDLPSLGLDLASAGSLRGVGIEDGVARVEVALPAPGMAETGEVEADCRAIALEVPGIRDVRVAMGVDVPRFTRPTPKPGKLLSVTDPWAGQGPVGEVRNVIAVASGKGGVGKSTVAANLAVALARLGAKAGLLDADIYGPSAPTMMGITGRPTVVGDRMQPLLAHGVPVMSIGLLTGEEDAQVWRGPMVQQALRQFLTDVDWGPLDYLVVDMPPGTGDAQLTLVQVVPLTGAVMVSTPQDVALADARKGITMFRKVHAEILGLVENMSWFECGTCGTRHEIFAHAGARDEAERQGVPFLGEIPLVPAVRAAGDEGVPVVVRDPESPVSRAFLEVARGVALQVARRILLDPKRAVAV